MNWSDAIEGVRREARTFTARLGSRCPACPERIEPGDEAKWAERGGGLPPAVVHAGCELIEAGAIAPRPTGVCPRCFTERAVNGSCACEEDR